MKVFKILFILCFLINSNGFSKTIENTETNYFNLYTLGEWSDYLKLVMDVDAEYIKYLFIYQKGNFGKPEAQIQNELEPLKLAIQEVSVYLSENSGDKIDAFGTSLLNLFYLTIKTKFENQNFYSELDQTFSEIFNKLDIFQKEKLIKSTEALNKAYFEYLNSLDENSIDISELELTRLQNKLVQAMSDLSTVLKLGNPLNTNSAIDNLEGNEKEKVFISLKLVEDFIKINPIKYEKLNLELDNTFKHRDYLAFKTYFKTRVNPAKRGK